MPARQGPAPDGLATLRDTPVGAKLPLRHGLVEPASELAPHLFVNISQTHLPVLDSMLPLVRGHAK